MSTNNLSLEESHALMGAFLSTDTDKFIEDVYRSVEDYICDGMDQLDAEFRRLAEDLQKSDRTRKKENKAKLDDSQIEEFEKGIDKLWDLFDSAYGMCADMFEVYCNRNIFVWAEGVPISKPAESGKIYTAAEEHTMDKKIAELEEKVKAERRRKRTLIHLQNMYAVRLPQAEKALESLETVFAKLTAEGVWPADEIVQKFKEKTLLLRSLCERLSAAIIPDNIAAPFIGSDAAAVIPTEESDKAEKTEE